MIGLNGMVNGGFKSFLVGKGIDVFHKWRLWHGNEARMFFSWSILVSNYQTDMFLCFIFAKIAK